MELIYKVKFYKALEKLPERDQQAVRSVLQKLKSASDLQSSGVDYTPIRAKKRGKKYFRIRVGNYRIGAEYIRPDLIIIIVETRGDIYKIFPPK